MTFDVSGDFHFDLSDVILMLVLLVLLYLVVRSTGLLGPGF